MELKHKLSQRIGINGIYEVLYLVQESNTQKQKLYMLLFDENDKVAYQAAWVFSHFSRAENRWLYNKQDALIDEALACEHIGKRRLLLTLIYRQPLANPPRTDFLDFCLSRMISKKEQPGVQSLCMKLAYEMCRPIPELLQEFRLTLDIMEPDLLCAALKSARRNILKAMQKGKSLQE